MQPIPIPQINCRHPDPPSPLIPPIIPRNLLIPEVPHISSTIFPKPNVDQEVGVVFARQEVWSGFVALRPKLAGDARAEGVNGVPAA
jgi:hypothetical protein